MRKFLSLLFILQLIMAGKVSSQNSPTGVTEPAAKTPVKPPKMLSASLFYKRTFTPKIPVTDPANVSLSSTIEDVGTATAYFDGMGRPLQTVIKQASPLKRDVVAPIAYDTWGNVYYSYLPYTAQTGNTGDGELKTSPFTADSAFYKSLFPEEDIYYGKTLRNGSPLNTITKQMEPGNSWAGANKGISYEESANNLSDSVRIWSISINNADDMPATTAVYPAGSLLVQTVTDERGKKNVSYINERGETVLTKAQLSNSPYAGHTGWLCTYYVYDEMSRLRMVIPPKATDALIDNGWSFAAIPLQGMAANLCYAYWYDNRGRVTEKHIPGKGEIYIAYDLLDRIVMTQDEKLRTTSQWAFVKYDEQSRTTQTGVITKPGVNKDTIINQAAGSSNYPALSGTYTVLAQTYYDDYAWMSEAPFDESLYTTPINSSNFITTYNTAPYYARQISKSVRIRGRVTGSKKLVLGTATYLYTAQLYDEDGRAIQTKQSNFSGGTDIATIQYSYAGLVLRQQLHHAKNSPGAQTHELLTKYSYDHEGRLKTIIKKIDAATEQLTASVDYDELGRAKTKTLGDALASRAYTYNIRGWLTGINKSYAESNAPPAGGAGGGFGESLSYDYGFTATQVNGNIAGIQWKSAGDNTQRAYGFTYDNANRLTKVDFTQKNSSSAGWTNDKMDFSVSGLSYDQNSNILKMNQRGTDITGPITIDSLKYIYFTNSNQLQKVKDFITDAPPMGDFRDTSYTGNDYAYDENGNLVKDNNKHIHSTDGGNGITLNILDKPDSIVVSPPSGGGTIRYTYDAAGGLLQKTVTDKKLNIKTVITYVAGFVYQKTLPSSGNASAVPDTLQYILHEEGRIRWSVTQSHPSGYFVYDYFLKDHLNNIRSVITGEKDTSFYPVASFETARLANEKLFYDSLDNGRTTKPGGYPTDNYTNPNDYVQKLNGSSTGKKTGAAILLKVMAGDKITVRTTGWYNNAAAPSTPASPLTDIVNALITTVPGTGGAKFAGSQLSGTVLNPGVTGFLNTRDAGNNSARPKAYLNIILFDEQLNPVLTTDGKNSYFQQVGASGSLTALSCTEREVAKSGYVYICVSNETPNIDVYFDNLQVTHIKGPLLQEEGYYPFGLEMKAIGSQAAMKPQTRYKFNAGTELEDNFDVNYYETYFRQYDAQIGRFTGVDALAEQTASISSYQFGNNNPIIFNDPSGLQIDAKPRGPLENMNPGFSAEPQWVTDSWDNYWSDPFNTFGGHGGGSANSDAAGRDFSAFWSNALSMQDFGSSFLDQAYINSIYTTTRFWYSNGINAVFSTAEFHNNVSFTEDEYYFYLGKTEPNAKQSDRGSQSNENYNWDNAKNTLDVLGGVFDGLQTTVRPSDMWLGKNGKYYNNSWGGNRYTGSRSGAFKAAGAYKWAGRGVVAVSTIIGGVEVYNGYKIDGNHFGYNAQLATASNAGGLIGGWGGAEAGSVIGGIVGGLFGGLGAIPGAAIGGFIGGWFGGQAGSYIGEQSVNYYYGR